MKFSRLACLMIASFFMMAILFSSNSFAQRKVSPSTANLRMATVDDTEHIMPVINNLVNQYGPKKRKCFAKLAATKKELMARGLDQDVLIGPCGDKAVMIVTFNFAVRLDNPDRRGQGKSIFPGFSNLFIKEANAGLFKWLKKVFSGNRGAITLDDIEWQSEENIRRTAYAEYTAERTGGGGGVSYEGANVKELPNGCPDSNPNCFD